MRVDGAAGPLALGVKGSVRDRLTPPGRAPGFRPREVYSIAALARYGAFGGILYTAFGGENHTTALRARKCNPPLVAGATTFPPLKRGHYGCWTLSHMTWQVRVEGPILPP